MSDINSLDDFIAELKAEVWKDKEQRMKAVYDNIVNPKRDHAEDVRERKRLLGLD